ncbi:fungal-specific transcription factor domain-containing protein [Mycena floridula]|nr:fungal-specific transcription factor domain-containing protein [Mycena floridula]
MSQIKLLNKSERSQKEAEGRDADTKPRCSNCTQFNLDCIFVRKSEHTSWYIRTLEERLSATEKLLQEVTRFGFCFLMISNECSQTMNPTVIPSDDDLQLIPRIDTVTLLGQSSGKSLLHLALHVKSNSTIGVSDSVLASVRPSFWNPRPWEASRVQRRPVYDFPPDELMTSLVDLFFHHFNRYLPLLHKPIFERLIAQRLHLDTSSKFGNVLCLVCAVGSRWSDDPRVLAEGHESRFSSGWKWYAAVKPFLFDFLESYNQPPSLYDLQATCLFTIFAIGNFSPHAMWSQLGIAIRAAQSYGVHRKKPWYKHLANPVTNELFKRVWWVLVSMDRVLSASVGRPCMILSEDFDVELPIECDDEYWEHPDPAKAFKQPSNKPSILSSFLAYTQLSELTALDSTDASHLDSALNEWAEDLPDHCKSFPNPEFLGHSAELQCAFYRLQMMIHRPFLPSEGKQSPLASASLAICTNAARSCSRVVEMFYQKTGGELPFAMPTVFNSGVVLLLQIWEGQRAGLDVSEKRADVQKCIDALQRSASRWPSAFEYKRIVSFLSCIVLTPTTGQCWKIW